MDIKMIFESIYTEGTNGIGGTAFVLCMAGALAMGLLIACMHMYKNRYSKNFILTVTVLPVIVQTVIMLVNGSLGTGESQSAEYPGESVQQETDSQGNMIFPTRESESGSGRPSEEETGGSIVRPGTTESSRPGTEGTNGYNPGTGSGGNGGNNNSNVPGGTNAPGNNNNMPGGGNSPGGNNSGTPGGNNSSTSGGNNSGTPGGNNSSRPGGSNNNAPGGSSNNTPGGSGSQNQAPGSNTDTGVILPPGTGTGGNSGNSNAPGTGNVEFSGPMGY